MTFNIKAANQYNQNMSSIESNSVFSFEFRNNISMEDVDNKSLDGKPTNHPQNLNDTRNVFDIYSYRYRL
jgi:hypothetical protein